MLGAIDQNAIKNGYFIASHPYFNDALTWCVQQKQPIPLWKNIFRLCNEPLVWIIFTIMIISAIITAYIMQQYEPDQPKLDWTRITMAGVCSLLGFVSNYKPKILANRILFAMILFGSLIFTIVILSLTVKLTKMEMFNEQIKMVDEIVRGSFELTGNQFSLHHLMQKTEVNSLLFQYIWIQNGIFSIFNSFSLRFILQKH